MRIDGGEMNEYPCHIPSSCTSGSGSGSSSGSISDSATASGATSTSNTSSYATCSKAIKKKKLVTIIGLKNNAWLVMKDAVSEKGRARA